MPLHSYSRAKKCALANNSMYVFISVSSVDSVTNRSYALGCNFSFKIVPPSPHHSENINSFFFQQIELVNFSESNGKSVSIITKYCEDSKSVQFVSLEGQ